MTEKDQIGPYHVPAARLSWEIGSGGLNVKLLGEGTSHRSTVMSFC